MARKRKEKNSSRKDIFSRINFTESYTSLLLGMIVVLIIGILFLAFAKVNRNKQTSSVKDEPKMEQQKSQEESGTVMSNDSKTSSTYTIKPGDDLWSISVDVYNDGYKWVEIAKTNKLENPGLIHVDNKLIIPTVSETPPRVSNEVVENNSITGETYTIKIGDNLWDISVRAYGDGFRWPEIAKANYLENPDLIFSDNILTLPR